MLGFNHAFRGLYLMLIKERNFKIQLFCFALALILGFVLNISRNEWLSIFIISALVLSIETVNSSIEKVCDLINKDKNSTIKNIKDISAAAALLASIFATIIGSYIFLPYLKRIFF